MGIIIRDSSKRKYYKEIAKEYTEKSINEDKYYLLGSDYFKKHLNNKQLDDKSLDFYYDLCNEWDEFGDIPLELGKSIEALVNNKKISFGIYKILTDVTIDENNVIHSDAVNSIFDKGINNSNNSSKSDELYIPEPNKILSPINNVMDAIICLKTDRVKYNVGILVGFPSKYVDKTLCIENGYEDIIYNIENNNFFIKTEYLLGLIYQENSNCSYYLKENMISKKSIIEII